MKQKLPSTVFALPVHVPYLHVKKQYTPPLAGKLYKQAKKWLLFILIFNCIAAAAYSAPVVSSFSPATQVVGGTVVITGTGFTTVTAVSFGGVAAASYVVNSTTQITAVVGAGASGSVSVTAGGNTNAKTGFTITAPTITSFTPTSAGIGGSVTITGTNFTGATAVTFNGTAAASFTVNSATSITAVVATGSTAGSVAVTTPGGTIAKTGFTIAAPTITSFTPTAAGIGSSVTITGTNFISASAVTFNGTAAASFTVNSATSITAVVNTGTTAGSVAVTTPGGTGTKTGFTLAAPAITSFTPTATSATGTVTITGTNLGGATAVSFGGTAALSFTVVGPTSITAVVNSGTSGSVSVTTPGGTGSLAGFTFTAPGYIYVHQKSLNEQTVQTFNYTLTSSTGYSKSFTLNNSPAMIQIGDIGSGHSSISGNFGDGELWVVGNSASSIVSVSPAGLKGTIFHRASGSSSWDSLTAANTILTVAAIDGAYYNQCVFINGNDVYFWNGTTATKIYDHTATGNFGNAVDVSAGGGKIAMIANTNRVYVNTGAYNTAGINTIGTTIASWTDITGTNTANQASRLDVNAAGTGILYMSASTTTQADTMTIAGGSQVVLNTFGTAPGTPDVAEDDKFKYYVKATSTIATAGDAVFSNVSGSWSLEPESRAVTYITAGAGGQAWCTVGEGCQNAIWARTTDGTHVWVDDERVRVLNKGSVFKTGGVTLANSLTNISTTAGVANGNAIMVAVPPGTYTLVETLPDATWDLGRYTTYVPGTSSLTTSVSTYTVNATVASGDVAHILYFNEKLSPKSIALTCTTSVLEDFGSDATGKTFGDTVQGTAYHYYPTGPAVTGAPTAPQDGYYYVVKDLSNWFITGNGLTSHSNSPNGYFLMCNASYAKDEFYRKRVTNLVPGLQYTISFYAANINFTTSSTVVRIPPNVQYGLQDANGTIVDSASTGSIDTLGVYDASSSSYKSKWEQYSFTFSATTSQADLYFRNNTIGGLGNDVAIDDISLNPVITPLPDIQVTPTIAPNVCIGVSYLFSNNQAGGLWTSSSTNIASITPKGGEATGLTAGNSVITYTYTNQTGCVSTKTTGIIVSAPPTAISVSDRNEKLLCSLQSDSLFASATGGTAPLSYSWSAIPASSFDGLSAADSIKQMQK